MKNLLVSVALGAGMLLPALAQDRLNCDDERKKTPDRNFEYVITCDRANGIYKVGEEASLTIRVRNAADASVATDGVLRIEFDGYDDKTFRTETHDIAKEGAVVKVKAGLPHPGIMRTKIYSGGQTKFSIWGVAFDPEKIEPDVEMPADFDSFWAEAVAKYDREVPEDFEMRFDVDQSTPWNDVYRYSFTAPDRTRLYGFVSYPKDRSKKYPARFEVPSAGIGVWTLGPSTYQRDRTVTMILNIFPFEMPKTVEAAFKPYRAWSGELEKKFGVDHYMAAGLGHSREEAFLYNYLLGANRAVNWLWRMKEVDQSRFHYWGGSQGGGFGALVMGINHRFTKGCLLVPCLANGLNTFGRLGTSHGISHQGSEEARARARKIIPYFAAENFARRISCPTMVTVGLCDVSCPAHGGWSIFNLIPAKGKAIVNAVNQPHGPPDPVWFGSQQWMYDDPGWKVTFGEQYGYIVFK